jgi:hypothetical protein
MSPEWAGAEAEASAVTGAALAVKVAAAPDPRQTAVTIAAMVALTERAEK